jgi:hypothetical protein
MNNFKPFAEALCLHFDSMSENELYCVDIPGQTIWEMYLEAFPEGTNPIYRVRTEHDGSYDRSVIRKIGNLVVINEDGSFTTIWDIPNLSYPYKEVCATLAFIIKSAAINNVFRIKERMLGYTQTTEKLEDGSNHIWHHFHTKIANKHYAQSPAEAQGSLQTTASVLERGLHEISIPALDTILDLIERGSLYRGDEFKNQIVNFRSLKKQFDYCSTTQAISIIVWKNVHNPVARFRNTVIGTLAVDLSNQIDLEQAVRSFEQKVAPTNYKRPTALITQGMIDNAVKKIEELDLESSLQRRLAKLSDVSVNDVLWVGNNAKDKMKDDGLTELLQSEVKSNVTKQVNENISIEDFVKHVLPVTQSMEVLMKNRLQSNLMTLTAPANEDARNIFKWSNPFAWSYNGNITDAIKEKVKLAGGNVKADIRVSLAWFNYDDLDIHCHGPMGHVYFGSRKGILDVDMNAGGRESREPVENLAFDNPQDGHYKIEVNQYSQREVCDIGFTIQFVSDGINEQYHYDGIVKNRVSVLEFFVKNGKIVDHKVLDKNLKTEGTPENIWGIQTETFVPVSTLMLSPNYWNGETVGNKHWFFLLEGCKTSEPVRGIYNEFLHSELDEYRKVFEVLGNKTKCEPVDEQMSGLGFSSTKREEVTVRVKGTKLNKTYLVKF